MLNSGSLATLLFPDRRGRHGLISWDRAMAWLGIQPLKAQEEFFRRYGSSAAISICAEIDLSHRTTRMVVAAMSAACCQDLDVFVASPSHAYFYQVKSEVWARSQDDLINPLRVARHGKLLLINSLLPQCSPEAEVAGQPLFVCESQLKRLIPRTGASRKLLEASGEAIVRDHLEKYPGLAMRRSDFLRNMQARHQSVSDRQVYRVWAASVPDSWRRSGPKTTK